MFSASAMVGEYCNVSFKELRLAVLYWERRLNYASTEMVWIKEGWFRDIVELPPTKSFTRNDIATEYTQALESKGKARLANLIMER